jgi:DNA repair protein RadC
VRKIGHKLVYDLLRAKLASVGGAVREAQAAALDTTKGNPQVSVMLKRIGLLRGGKAGEKEAVEAAIRKISAAAGETEDAVARTIVQYAVGPRGDGVGAICGVTPRCAECPPRLPCRHRSPHPTIKSLPEDERPRERLIQGGDEPLTDSELLAIIIRDGTPEASALELARRLVSRYQSFRQMDTASITDLCAVKGIGPAKAAQIKAALAIGRRLNRSPLAPRKKLAGAQAVFEHFCEMLRDKSKETFWSVLLDQKNQIIKTDRVSVGSLSESLVHPREVFRAAIREASANVVFVHNHPSGDPQPSQEDIEITKKLVQAGQIVGIPVLDHVVIAGDRYVSMKSLGMM